MGRPKGAKDKKPRVRSGNHVKIDRVCTECGNPFVIKRKDGGSVCKKCLNTKRVRDFKAKHPGYSLTDKARAQRRHWNLANKYGIDLVRFNEMSDNQGGLCAICGKEQTRGHSLCVDHNHKTGKVRGLLCHKCNQGIGLLGDEATHAAQYLLSHSGLSWDRYFMSLAILASSRSKDRSTKVGAVIVRDKVAISTGYNGFPRGVNDDVPERHERPLKYQWVCHAEENAVLNAARIGAKVSGSTLYVTLHPCSSCAKMIIQSEIRKVMILPAKNKRWTEDFEVSRAMLDEVGIPVVVCVP